MPLTTLDPCGRAIGVTLFPLEWKTWAKLGFINFVEKIIIHHMSDEVEDMGGWEQWENEKRVWERCVCAKPVCTIHKLQEPLSFSGSFSGFFFFIFV